MLSYYGKINTFLVLLKRSCYLEMWQAVSRDPKGQKPHFL